MPDGYFTDDSMLRIVHRERAVALSGPRALLMQATHPLAVSGLLAHSTAVDEPYERLARTAQVMDTIGFGTRAEADRVTKRVRAMHKRVRGKIREDVGPYPAGTPYAADDADLLLWVLFTLVDSGIVVYDKYVRSMSDAEQAAYWEDYKVVGELFGLEALRHARHARGPAGLQARHAHERQARRDRLGAHPRPPDRARAAGADRAPAAPRRPRTS